MHFSGKVYDVIKYIAQIVLPGIGTLYFGLAPLWHLPSAEAVVGTVVVVDTFLGAILGISSYSYDKNEKYAGAMIVTEDAVGKKTISLELEGDPHELDQKSEVTFKVNKA